MAEEKKAERKAPPKKADTEIPINDGGDHSVTDDMKRVNLKWWRKRGGRG